MKEHNPVYNKANIGNKGIKQNLTPEQRQKRRDRMTKVNAKGFVNRGGKTKFYYVDGMLMQGQYEVYWYQQQTVKPNKCKPIKTPYGYYTPDFEYLTHFVEIKSTYTLVTCVCTGQMRKIKWVRKHIKPVKIVVVRLPRTSALTTAK